MKAFRRKRWKASSKPFQKNPAGDGPVLRSSRDQAVDGLDENYIVNLMLLSDGLRQCRQCGKRGPLSLDNLSKPPTRIGLGVVLQMKCRDCKKEHAIKTFHSHRTGRRGPGAVTFNSMAALAMLHTGQGLTHVNADLPILGIGSLTTTTYKKT